MKKRSPLLMAAVGLTAVFAAVRCTLPPSQAEKKENTVVEESESKGYHPGMQIDYVHYKSLPYIVGSADEVVRASIIKDHGLKTIKEGEDYNDYRIYTMNAESSYKLGSGPIPEFTLEVENFAERKELSEDGFYFLKKKENEENTYRLITPVQGDLPVVDGNVIIPEESRGFFPDKGEKIPVEWFEKSLEDIIG